MDIRLSIIIPSKDRPAILKETLRLAYKAVVNISAEILVVNDSKTETIALEPQYRDKVKVLDNHGSGVASARNRGARQAQGELLLFLDDDMWISEENLRATLKLHAGMQNCCINFNWVYPPELDQEIKKEQFGRYLHHYGFTSLRGWCRGQFWEDTRLFATDGITSQYLSIKKEDFWRVGGYNEDFPHAGFEDHDLYKRMKTLGIQPYIYPLSMVYHNEADRMSIKAWLARKKRGGETRKVAVEMGYAEVATHYGLKKKAVYTLLKAGKPGLYKLLLLIPNLPQFDPLYFKIVNLLLGTASYEGYHAK